MSSRDLGIHARRSPEHAGVGSASRGKLPRRKPGQRGSRGLTCSNCRSRKVRCDGAQPACKMCELYNDDCRYDKPPPMTQLVAMAKRLQEAEQTIAALQSGADSGGDTNNMLAHEDSWASPTRLSSHNQPTSSNMHPSLSVSVNASSLPPQDESWNEGSISSARLSHSPGLTVDEQGNARYYGPTSAVRDPSQHGDSPLPNIQSGVAAYQDTSTHNSLDSHTRESAVWEEFAFGNASLHTCIPRQVIAKLLHIHFTWVGPMFLWVHRSAFIHDMATGGRHYSEFLLVVLCAHAAKYQLDSTAEMLLTRARALIGTAIQQSSSIPTIQALLQLSASELAQGSISQTWVYSGIAFRMASDLGLQYSDAVKGLDPIDLEVRRRLHWSCYFWDKVTSLYTGRLPSITESLDESSLESLDRSADSMDWTPYFGDSFHPCKISQSQYQPTSNHIVACFINSCKLSVIINDIITRIYHHQGQTVIEASFKDIKVRLNQWRTQSPIYLRCEPESLPAICPPSHVISQNLLYFASVILTHRPFWAVPLHYQVCLQAARSMETLVLLFESTFDLGNITYLMGYCIYTGASVILEDAKKNRDSAHAILRTFLRALNAAMRRCRLLERSLNIIVREMSRLRTSSHQSENLNAEQAPVLEQREGFGGHIPAFPFVDPAASVDFGMDSYMGRPEIGFIQSLDSYPEMQMDVGTLFATWDASL